MTDGAHEISAPEHLNPDHELTAFDSGLPALDDWLKRRALANEHAGASRTYGVCAGGRVVGYAILRTLQAAELGGIRAILVHAISGDARRFYERHGFVESPVDPMTLMITITDPKKALGSR